MGQASLRQANPCFGKGVGERVTQQRGCQRCYTEEGGRHFHGSQWVTSGRFWVRMWNFFYRPHLSCLSHSHPCEDLPPRGILGRCRGAAGAQVSPEDPARPVCMGLSSGCGPKLGQSSSCPGPHSSRSLFPLHIGIFATSGLNFPKCSEVLRAFLGAWQEGVLS